LALRASAEPVVRAERLRKEFRMGEERVAALDGVSFEIRQGEYWAVMGASGSGKSTLLYLLGCLDRATSGRYVLAGEDTSALSDDELSEIRGRHLGFIFQSFHLIPQLTVLENIEAPSLYDPRPLRGARDRAARLARRVGLGDRLRHKPAELSGGQQQRVAIARALLNEPALLLADEATGNLDSSTATEILELFDELHAEGKTIVTVTHDPAVARRANRVLRLKDGKVLAIEETR
jgi:putative ABC transport system ATP-binding protein